MLPPQRALLAFEAVSRLGSIGAASRELHVTQAAVSQQLKSLEQFLNCTLFIRNQRGVTLTQAAQQYLPVVAGSLQHLKLQTQILFGAQQSDVLRIKANTSIGHNWLIPKLADFSNKFSFIKLDLTLVDWPSRQPCSEADVEITNGFIDSEDTQVERLCQEQWLMVCSPAFQQQHLDALANKDISQLPAIQVKGYEESWMQWLCHHDIAPEPPNIQLEISNSLHGLEAAKQGIGLMLVRSLVAKKALTSGELVLALNGSMPSDSGHYVITANKRSAKVNFFCDWLHQQDIDSAMQAIFSNA
ncbi:MULTISPECIES: LysR substrate-binding domain-containing protein [unclassified Moritella]|uniref:LysR substrate-binding domain-containing protein n=1 Tax=unclassified Moritella TaxID=2637987 RepID=UPI001BAE15CA|nr:MULTISPECIES: LysR substrate-binding domain-containing protein [unclassified Moritella]QUM83423.1 LysR family transcriptional regulator [Moritella sp. 28]QUM87729.1 LysR family transcriptional regulator [Moritella sp. 36]